MKKIAIICLLSAFISGCYTILQHPEISKTDENGIKYRDVSVFDNDCSKCHNSRYSEYTYDYDRYNDYYNEGYYQNDYQYIPRNEWVGYYQVPWWYKPSIVVSSSGLPTGGIKIDDNRTTKAQPDIRSTGTTRNGTATTTFTPPNVTRSTGSSSSGSSTSTDSKKTETTGSERTGTRSGSSSNENKSSSNSNSSNTSNSSNRDDRSNSNTNSSNTRNTGSNRGK